MNLISYIKERGLKRALEVFWLYKLPKLQISLMSALTKRVPLRNKLMIESHNDFDCNGGAFYNYLVENGYNSRVKIVWLLNHPLDREMPENVYAVPLRGPSLRKAWHVCTARWFTADCSATDKVRSDQVSLYMSHGIFGLKNFRGLVDVPSSIDYLLSPSAAMDEVIKDMSNVDDSSTRLVHLGYPMLDRLYLGLHSKGYEPEQYIGKTLFLWMPTFRKGTSYGRDDADGSYPYGIPLIDNWESLLDLADFAKTRNAVILIKLHPKQDLSAISHDVPDGIEFVTGEDMRSAKFDTCDLMLDSAALISDYSGAVFEYMALNRPVAFVMADLERYKLGLVDDADRYMPGPKIFSTDGLKSFIDDICSGVDRSLAERSEFRSWFYAWNDGRSCERIAYYLGLVDEDELL